MNHGFLRSLFAVLLLSFAAPACRLLAASRLADGIAKRVREGTVFNEGDWIAYKPRRRSLLPLGEYQFVSSTIRQHGNEGDHDKRDDGAAWLVVRWRMRNSATGPVDVSAESLTVLTEGPSPCQALRADPNKSTNPVTVAPDHTSAMMEAVFELPSACSRTAPLLAPTIDRRGLDPEWATGQSVLFKTVETSERRRFKVRLKP